MKYAETIANVNGSQGTPLVQVHIQQAWTDDEKGLWGIEMTLSQPIMLARAAATRCWYKVTVKRPSIPITEAGEAGQAEEVIVRQVGNLSLNGKAHIEVGTPWDGPVYGLTDESIEIAFWAEQVPTLGRVR